MLSFIIALFIGFVLGMFVIAILAASSSANTRENLNKAIYLFKNIRAWTHLNNIKLPQHQLQKNYLLNRGGLK